METTPMSAGECPALSQSVSTSESTPSVMSRCSSAREPSTAAWMREMTSAPYEDCGFSRLAVASCSPVFPSSRNAATVVVPMSTASKSPGATGSMAGTSPKEMPRVSTTVSSVSGTSTAQSSATTVWHASTSEPFKRTTHFPQVPRPPQGAERATPFSRSSSNRFR